MESLPFCIHFSLLFAFFLFPLSFLLQDSRQKGQDRLFLGFSVIVGTNDTSKRFDGFFYLQNLQKTHNSLLSNLKKLSAFLICWEIIQGQNLTLYAIPERLTVPSLCKERIPPPLSAPTVPPLTKRQTNFSERGRRGINRPSRGGRRERDSKSGLNPNEKNIFYSNENIDQWSIDHMNTC